VISFGRSIADASATTDERYGGIDKDIGGQHERPRKLVTAGQN